MNNTRSRKYPRVHEKSSCAEEESIMNISATTAISILAVTFIQGILLGYFFNKKSRR